MEIILDKIFFNTYVILFAFIGAFGFITYAAITGENVFIYVGIICSTPLLFSAGMFLSDY